MRELFESPEFCITLVLGSYLLGKWIFKKTKFPLFQPVVIAVIVVIAYLQIAGVDHLVFAESTRFISFMLGPSVVALGYILYEQLEHIKGNVFSILTSLLVGAVVGVVSVLVMGKLFGLSEVMIFSLEPKSVTMPIALSVSKQLGGDVSLTAVFVLFAGVLGSIIGSWFVDMLGVKSRIAKGLAMGASAHGIGTGRAIEIGALEGAVGGIAIGLMGIATAILIPVINAVFM